MQCDQTVDTHQQYPWITTMPERFVCSNYELTLECVLAYAWLKTVNPKCLLDRRTYVELETMDASQNPTYAIWNGDPKSQNLSVFRDLETFINYIGRFAIPTVVHDEALLDLMNDRITRIVSDEGRCSMLGEVMTSQLFMEQELGNFEFQPENPYAAEFSYQSDEAFLRCTKIPMQCIKAMLDCHNRLISINEVVLAATGEREDNIVVLPKPVLLTKGHYEMMNDEKKRWVVNPLRLPRTGVQLLPVYPPSEPSPLYAREMDIRELSDMVEDDDRVVRVDVRFRWFQCATAEDAVGFAKRINAYIREK